MAIRLTKRHGVAGGLVALVLGGAVLGTALAQPSQPGGPAAGLPEHGRMAGRHIAGQKSERGDAFTGKLAGRLGIDEQKLRDAIKATRLEMVDEAVKAGRLSPEQAARIKQQIEQGGGFARGPGAMGSGGPHAEMRMVLSKTVADSLGLTPEELRAKLPGKSITQLATELGKDPAVVKEKLKTALESRLDEAVKVGKVTPERAAEMKKRLADHLDRLMTRTFGNR